MFLFFLSFLAIKYAVGDDTSVQLLDSSDGCGVTVKDRSGGNGRRVGWGKDGGGGGGAYFIIYFRRKRRIAVISITPYLENKGEHIALSKINKNVSITS